MNNYTVDDLIEQLENLRSQEAVILRRLCLAPSACRPISNDVLSHPFDVIPPKALAPKFVGPDDWLSDVEIEISAYLQSNDDAKATDRQDDSIDRIPPMALVRCSRGGKTRALYEIANKMRGINNVIESKVACLYVSFNDSTSIADWEQECPLQALLRRIAFSALPQEATETSARDRFLNFLKDKPTWKEESFLQWLAKTPCILFIDEMNNLNKLTEPDSVEAARFGIFIKDHFISQKNRYFVFSSHIMATIPFFGIYMDPSNSSSRPTTVQALPLVPSLEKAHELRQSLDSTREAVYYGLMPGMIFEAGKKGKNIDGKRRVNVNAFLSRINSREDFEHAFLAILKSLLDGDWDDVPRELYILLDATLDEDGITHRVRWVPYHLQYVLRRLGASRHDESKLAEKLSDLCNLMKEAKEESGEGWEGLFVLFLFARCLNKMSDGVFVPEEWFKCSPSSPKIFFNGPYSAGKNKLSIGECKTWDQFKKGLVHGETPQLSIWYPTHNSFEIYDIVAVYSDGGEAKSIYGYQLKEGKAPRTHAAYDDIDRSLFVQGNPPKETINQDRKGWTVPSRSEIKRFFGVSGKHWTPDSWKEFGNQGYK